MNESLRMVRAGSISSCVLAAALTLASCTSSERAATAERADSTPSSKQPAAAPNPEAKAPPHEHSHSSPGARILDAGDGVAVPAPPHEIIPLAHEIMIELGMNLGLSNVNIREGAAVGYDEAGTEIRVLVTRTGESSSLMRVETADRATSPICEDIRDLILARTGS